MNHFSEFISYLKLNYYKRCISDRNIETKNPDFRSLISYKTLCINDFLRIDLMTGV